MKIILNLLILCVLAATAQAQQLKSPQPADTKVMTTEEANRLNGTAQPTINGKPYNQYKAEQDALKQKNATAAATAPTDIIAITPADVKKASAAKLPELTAAQQNAVKATTAELTKNWAPKDPAEDPNKPKQALSEEAMKQRQELNKTVDAPATAATAAATTPGTLNKPVMAGQFEKSATPVTAPAVDPAKALDKTQGPVPQPVEEVKTTPAKVEAKPVVKE